MQWCRGAHTSVNRSEALRQSILIRMRRSGDQSRGWRCSRQSQSRRGPDLSCTADRAQRQHWTWETPPFFAFILCPSFLAALCLPHLFYLFIVSPSFHFDYSLLFHFCPLLLLLPPSLTLSLYFCLLPTICHPLSSSVTPAPLSHSFSLPQSNSRSFIGIIRWILLSLCLSIWEICLPLTYSPLLMLLHKTQLYGAVQVMVTQQREYNTL